MQTPFQPSAGSQVATIQLQPLCCMGCADNVITLVRRIVGMDEVHLSFDTSLLTFSFFPPATEDQVRRALFRADFELAPTTAPMLTVEEAEPQAIPA